MASKTIRFMVCPGASHDRIHGLHGDYIKVSIKAMPQKGQANKHFTEFIAAALKMPKSNITIISGEKSRYKRVHIKNPTQTDIISKLLKHQQ